jgi:hypothetical protein
MFRKYFELIIDFCLFQAVLTKMNFACVIRNYLIGWLADYH